MIFPSKFRASPRAVLSRALLTLCLTGLSAWSVLGAGTADAAPPAQRKTQVPGFYRMKLGEFEVTALYDGNFDSDPKVFLNTSADEVRKQLARQFVPGPVPTSINGFLVNTGEQLILVDAGTATGLVPGLGSLVDNLRAAGYEPAQVDLLLITHMHFDHLRGLLTPEGQPVFPNAMVRAAQAEADYWLEPKNEAQVTPDKQFMFKVARDAVAAYSGLGHFKTFQPGEMLAGGVSVVPAAGHTPGSSAYLFTSKDQSLLACGDIVHSHVLQFSRPDTAFYFDVDAKQAVATRKRLFTEAAKNKYWIAGGHLPFPGIGHVRAEGAAFAWVPAEFGPFR